MLYIKKTLFKLFNFITKTVFVVNKKYVYIKLLSSKELLALHTRAQEYCTENNYPAGTFEYDFIMDSALLYMCVRRLDGKAFFCGIDDVYKTLGAKEILRIIKLYDVLDNKNADRMMLDNKTDIKMPGYNENWDFNENFPDEVDSVFACVTPEDL